jgi:hypothetical protein
MMELIDEANALTPDLGALAIRHLPATVAANPNLARIRPVKEARHLQQRGFA